MLDTSPHLQLKETLLHPRQIITGALKAPMPALPVDLFRILVGLLSIAYFLRTLREFDEMSHLNGMINHEMLVRWFPYTRLGLFYWLSAPWQIYVSLVIALLAAVAVTIGYRPRLAAAVMYLIAVSTYRWNFLVIYVDDTIMHIVMLWVALMPIGRTLTLWPRPLHPANWLHEHVAGLVPRLFLINLALLYIVAGLWKWNSPLWREGIALYATLKLPISYGRDFWQLAHLPWLTAANYAALIIEPLLALIVFLPKNHWLKWLLLPAFISFHLGIILTLKIPFANIATIAALVLVFREEMMDGLRRLTATSKLPSLAHSRPIPSHPLAAWIAVPLIICLVLSMAFEATTAAYQHWQDSNANSHNLLQTQSAISTAQGRATPRNPFQVILYGLGVVQSYRLFDWIDLRNYDIRHIATEQLADGRTRTIDSEAMFPTTLRHVLLQSQLHNQPWLRVPPADMPTLRRDLFTRYARRYCQIVTTSGPIHIERTIQRITAANLALNQPEQTALGDFRCKAGSVMDLEFAAELQER